MIISLFVEMAHAATEAATDSPVTGGSDILNMVLGAGPMVKAIMAALFVLSLLCWAIIAEKVLLMRKAVMESEKFISLFEHSSSPSPLSTGTAKGLKKAT